MKRIKIKQRIANAFGYDLIRRTKNHDTFEAHFHNLVEKYGINCVIDVGANRGQYGAKLRELGFKGRICSFEPVTENFSDLQKAAAADPDWRVFRCALGEEDREAEINVFRATVLASFLSPAKALKEMFRSDNNSEIKSKEKVPVKPLSSFWDNMIEDIGVPKVMLKMDTQGYDLKVFKGALSVKNQIAVLQSELSSVPLYDGMPDYLSVLEAYRHAGFEISGIFPVSRNLQDLRIVEFDCLLVNTSITGPEKFPHNP